MPLLSKEFLEQLQQCCEQFTIIDYIMHSKNLSFHDAVLELAQYCDLKPEYFIAKDDKESFCREKHCAHPKIVMKSAEEAE